MWALPASSMKNRMLRRFGHDVDPSASIGPNIVLGVKNCVLERNSRVRPFNVIRDLTFLRVGEKAMIGSFNWISAHPDFRGVDPSAGTVEMGYGSRIGGRCYIDASGLVRLGDYACLGGTRCFVQTHQPDFDEYKQRVGMVSVGHHSLIGSCAVMLMGSALPEKSVLAANATLLKRRENERLESGLYAGSPAKWRRATKGDYFERSGVTMEGAILDEPLG